MRATDQHHRRQRDAHDSSRQGEATPALGHSQSHALRDWLIALGLMVAVFACYAAVRNHGLVNYDDETYLLEQKRVAAGLTMDNVGWAFTTMAVANWHPLTWLSYMLDAQICGLDNPGGFHVTNVIFHALNSALLFGLLRFMTRSTWRSALVAAIFALHPQRVESVAWVAERKDVLCAFFAFASLWAYAWYARRPGMLRYLLMAALFALGLMSKPMLVTLPCVMLLLDIWPLNRVERDERGLISLRCVRLLVLEKLPLLAMSAAVCVMTVIAQRDSGAMQDFKILPLDTRMANAAVSYVMYIAQMFWPKGFVPNYGPPLHPAAERWAAALLFLLTVTAVCVWQARRRPFMIVGWLWYVGMLVPVIGLIQVGGQARADRYTYLPMIGVYIMLVWLIPPLTNSRRQSAMMILRAGAALIVLGVLAALTVRQVDVWKDSRSLWDHTIAVTGGFDLVYSNRGDVHRRAGDLKAAEADFRMSLQRNRNYADGYYNLGIVLGEQGRTTEALAAYLEAVKHKPELALAHYNIGNIMSAAGRKQEAAAAFEMAIKAKPNYAEALNNLGNVLYDLQRYADAEARYRQAIEADPQLVFAHQGLAHALYMQKRYDEARAQLQVVLRLKPDHPPALRMVEMLKTVP